ncbi:OmpA/MotB family protein [Halomonas salina]|uniref:Flagellar motor protein MotB n=1 Tax=Halomonas salina TaxID=42565 RepID=A0ABR4WPU1_9GAMM|nr:OmpA family protein [Halomonas salina]KGE76732.1 flagellar motor protein MotB [Halomonas salina]
MLDRDTRQALAPPGQGGEEGESWLMSYLDVLTLLITLFVLLLSMSSLATGEGESEGNEIAAPAMRAALAVGEGLQPRHAGLQPRFQGLGMDGVSVERTHQGLTLRIEDRLLFDSGRARVTAGGRQVLSHLAERLVDLGGEISVEGHTDSLPIATSRFPSNWELSTGRASAVVRALAEEGVPRDSLRAIGYADTRPLAANDDAAGRAANRRVELVWQEPEPGA